MISKLINEKKLSVALLAASNLVAPALSFFVLPFLAKYYSPDLFGEYFFIFSVATVLSLLMTFTLHQGIISEKTPRGSIDLFLECVIGSSLICIFFIFFIVIISFFINIDGLVFAASCILSLFFGWGQMALNLLARFKFYRLYSGLMICRAFLVCGLQVLCSVLGIVGWQILCGSVIVGEFVVFLGVVTALRVARLGGGWRFKKRIRFTAICRNKSFAKFYMPSQLIGIGVNYFPLYVMKYFGDLVGVGLYGMSIRLIGVPIGAVINSLKATFWRQCAHLTYEKISRIVILKWSRILIFGGVSALIYKIFELKISWFLGVRWVALDEFIIPLILWQATSLAAVYVVEVFKNTGRQKYVFFYELLSAFIKLVAAISAIFLHKSVLLFFLWGAFLGNIASTVVLLAILFFRKQS